MTESAVFGLFNAFSRLFCTANGADARYEMS